MINLKNAPDLLNILLRNYYYLDDTAKSPSKVSIQAINKHFGITVPQTLINLLKASTLFRRWICSFGTNYTSESHVIRATGFYRKQRIRRKSYWQYRMPRNFIILRMGHDKRNLCLDMNRYNKETGEYGLQYWFPGYENELGDSYNSVEEFIVSFIKFHINNTSQEIKSECQNIIRKSVL